jgi:hypothetical protein
MSPLTRLTPKRFASSIARKSDGANHLFLGTETDQCQSAELLGDKSTSMLPTAAPVTTNRCVREGHPEQRADAPWQVRCRVILRRD